MTAVHVPALLLLALGCNREALGDLVFGELEGIDSDEPDAYGAWTSFDTSPDGSRLTMSTYDRKGGGVVYAVGAPDASGALAWVFEEVDGYVGDNGIDSGDRGKYSAQRTMPDGTVWVAYQDVTGRTLRARHRLGPGAWEESAAIDTVGTGAWASMAVDDEGHPVVVHVDSDRGAVRRTAWDGSSWSSEDLYVSAGGSVANTTLAIEKGTEYVAFFDAAAGQLHLLVDGADEVVDGAGAGAWPSLLVSGSSVRIAYQDAEKQDLKYATGSPGSWDKVAVDEGELRGADTAILDLDGNLTILYFDGYDNDLRIARRDAAGWTTDRLEGETVAAGYHNRLVAFGGKVWWFSYDHTNDRLLAGTL